MKKLLLIGLIFLFYLPLLAQNVNDYQTATSGDWNVLSTWERWNGTSWQTPSSGEGTPNNASGVISIMPDHTVTIPNGVSINADEVIVKVDANAITQARLIISAGATLTIFDGNLADLAFEYDADNDLYASLNVNGTLIFNDVVSTSQMTANNVSFAAGSKYVHNYSTVGGTIPSAVWDVNSTVEIIGYTSLSLTLSGLSQTFGNFTYNCPNQTGFIAFAGALTSVNGNFLVLSTGASGSLRLALGQTTVQNFGKNFEISGNSRVMFATSGSPTLNITGNFIYSSSLNSSFGSTGNPIINVGGDFTMNNSSGVINMSTNIGTATLNVKGGFNFTNGTISETSTDPAGNGVINFNGTSVQNFIGGGNFSNTINFSIASNAILDLEGENVLNGTGTFTSSGTLRVGSSNISGAITGSIPNTLTKIFNAGSTIVFDGASIQYADTPFPANVNITIDKPGTTPNNRVRLLGNYTLQSSRLINLINGILSLEVFTLTINGNVSFAAGQFASTSGSNMIISGTGALTLPFTAGSELYFFRNKRNGKVTLANNLEINDLFALESGELNIDNVSLILNGTIENSNFIPHEGVLSGNNSSRLVIRGTGAFGEINFGGVSNSLGSLTIERPASGTVTLGNNLLITDSLNLYNGTLISALQQDEFLQMGTGSTIVRKASGGTFAPTAVSSYNLVYQGTTNFTTGPELPTSSTALNNLTLNTSSTVTLSSPIEINGNLTMTAGSLSSSSSNFNISLHGNFVSNGGLVANSNTFTLSGASPQTISGSPVTFYNLTNATASAKNLSTNITVSNNLTLNGGGPLGSTGSFIHLTNPLATALTTTGASRIVGEFRRNVTAGTTPYSFPTGSAGSLERAEITFSSLGGLSYASLEFSPTSPGSSLTGFSEEGATYTNVVQNGYWIIEGNETSAPEYTVSMFPSFVPDASNSAFTIGKRSGSSPWVQNGNPFNPTTPAEDGAVINDGIWSDGSVRRAAITGFSNLSILGSPNPLPVDLYSFTAKLVKDYVQLDWVTLSEVKSSHFVIERSRDGIHFDSLSTLASAGFSSERLDYKYSDFTATDVLADVLYYRLNQVDVDGENKVYPMVAVNVEDIIRNTKIKIYPNPASVDVTVASLLKENVQLQIFNPLGKLIDEKTIGSGETSLNTSSLEKGVYVFKFINGKVVINKKVVVN